ncbi:conserved hypothetical protein [Culex quinquefasciatus]|uniref:Av71 muscle cell intermediate filament n=1 Tax=Culex quinquefasciatus TaxID=7176 RepID=B0WMZ0_CULQU|nr:conserved hypothetical protein [Culex quinquefasciatus]|eukprot:XP_001850074.1 conserved hypothetical protein [Culex quinquefasciatus]
MMKQDQKQEQEQETRNKKQETRNKKQETRNKKQETRNKKQETRNKKQETRNKKQETRNKKQETRNKKQETRNKKQETRNKKQETRNKKQETRNKKSSISNLVLPSGTIASPHRTQLQRLLRWSRSGGATNHGTRARSKCSPPRLQVLGDQVIGALLQVIGAPLDFVEGGDISNNGRTVKSRKSVRRVAEPIPTLHRSSPGVFDATNPRRKPIERESIVAGKILRELFASCNYFVADVTLCANGTGRQTAPRCNLGRNKSRPGSLNRAPTTARLPKRCTPDRIERYLIFLVAETSRPETDVGTVSDPPSVRHVTVKSPPYRLTADATSTSMLVASQRRVGARARPFGPLTPQTTLQSLNATSVIEKELFAVPPALPRESLAPGLPPAAQSARQHSSVYQHSAALLVASFENKVFFVLFANLPAVTTHLLTLGVLLTLLRATARI